MNLQEIFDTALAGVRKQGCGAYTVVDGVVKCEYTDAKGNHCNIGHVIPPSITIPNDLRRLSVKWLMIDIRVRELRAHLQAPLDALQDIQAAHDFSCSLFGELLTEAAPEEFLADYERRMSKVAEKYGLTYSAP